MGSEQQVFQQSQTDNAKQHTAPVDWNTYDNSWSQEHNSGKTCRQVGNTIVCEGDIYGTNSKPSTYGEAFKAIIPLAQDLGITLRTSDGRVMNPIGVYRAGDTQQPSQYYPSGTLTMPADNSRPYASDQYNYYQNQGTSRPADVPAPGAQSNFDPLNYHQNDRNPATFPPFRPIELPIPPVAQPVPPKPGNVADVNPGEQRPPVNQPRPETQPGAHDRQPQPCQPRQYQPCQPRPYQQHCQPHQGGWYPGKIAHRVIGRVFGGGRHCR